MQAASSTSGQLFSAIVGSVADRFTREVAVAGTDTGRVARELVDALRAPDLRLALVFADRGHDPAVLARTLADGLAPATSIGGTALGLIAPGVLRADSTAIGLGLYGDWLRVGVGIARDLSKSALTRSRDAVEQAAVALGATSAALDPLRHVGITLFDGGAEHEEAFCIGSAAGAPQIRMIGGSTAVQLEPGRRTAFWVGGEVLADAGAVIVLDSELPFHAVTSAHLVPTEVKTVVTAGGGRVIEELDGRPAVRRLTELVAQLGGVLDWPRSTGYAFARYVDGVPYLRSITYLLDGERIHVASGVETGHVLRVMRPGDLIGTTNRDLALAADRVGGIMATLLVVSCIGRHREADVRGLTGELADAYAAHPAFGYHSGGEQSGMLFVNNSLTGLAIGARR